MTRCILYDLPVSVKGFVREDENGDPVCILNARLTRESNAATLMHELKHIKRHDLTNQVNVSELEACRHK